MHMIDQSFGIVPVSQRQNEHHFLLIQHQAGHWGFPKGHAESGETALMAACREFEEETGITDYQLLEAPAFVEQYRFLKQQTPIDKTVTYFVALVRSEQVTCQAKEVIDFAWLPFEAAVERITFTQSKELLRQVEQFLQKQEFTQESVEN